MKRCDSHIIRARNYLFYCIEKEEKSKLSIDWSRCNANGFIDFCLSEKQNSLDRYYRIFKKNFFIQIANATSSLDI